MAFERLKHAWNAFVNDGRLEEKVTWETQSFSTRPDRNHIRVGNERTIVASIYTRIAIDAAAWNIYHVRVDENGIFNDVINSGLNDCFNVEANLDQAATAFLQDAVHTMLEEGTVAIIPIDTTLDPNVTGSYDIQTMRVGKVIRWHPQHVTCLVYDERDGRKKEIKLPKRIVAIAENPLYAVMNEPNSTLQRLNRKLALLDVVDEQASSGKLDILIQLPYTVRSDARKLAANQRRKDIEDQLKDSKYGVAYIDGTEKVTQLNRPAENNLLKTIEYLTNMGYGQLGITEQVMNGTADEATMLNYYSRTVKPILKALTEAMKRTFLTKTARTQGQSIMFFRDPFELLTVGNLAEAADKLSRNAIVVPNEFRPYLGLRPSNDPMANRLSNKNMPADPTVQAPPGADPTAGPPPGDPTADPSAEHSDEGEVDAIFAELNATIDQILKAGSENG